MKILFATTNPAKIKKYSKGLEEKGIQVLTIKDLGIELDVEETGKTALENAYIKAKAYYDETGIPSIGLDANLYIEGIPEEKQPGTHVRRVNNKSLTDNEMIEHYTNLVKEYGGKLKASWIHGMVIYDGKEKKEKIWNTTDFYFFEKPSEKRNPGYPLDSISKFPKCDKYFVEMTEEEKSEYRKAYNTEEIVQFITDSLQ